ncbi:hypothetical protein B296_00023983 [Ensete ventricosum]|uniref:SWIM-type domain-containing protein n=1 Tax=Ensete ventricosum TaxID=4639 RepID=A0A426ZTL7_ENSVE|nr:hypothetical protein B296_00023983 [Ensete ventricosum]
MTSPAVSITVADAVWEQIKSSRSASDDHLSMIVCSSLPRSSLHFLFGRNLERATRIVDQGGVRKVSAAPSGRSFFLVVGESKRKEEYICFPEHHCTCYSFFYDVVNRGEHLCCKHQIAARLAEAVGEVVEVEVSDEQLATMLSKL